VVIIGQDPYGEGEANGLAFSVNDGVKSHLLYVIFLESLTMI
jgi:uracil DNA glycosylase